MVVHKVPSLSQRPIRELVCADIEEPLKQRKTGDEQRRNYRYARRLPGTLIVDGQEHPVTCVDIGYGGIQVIAPSPLSIASGKRVDVGITLGTSSFHDEFSVVHSESTPDGLAIRLKL